MPLAIQYHHNNIVDQLPVGGLTTADITAITGYVCNVFCSVKDSNDNCYIVCCSSSPYADTPIVLIKIDESNNKTIARLKSIGYANWIKKVILSRDEQTLFFVAYNSQQSNYIAYSTPVTFTNGSTEIIPTSYRDIFSHITGMDIYQDRYIWTAHSTTVKVFNYDTKALIDSETITGILAMCCSTDNIIYSISADLLTVCTLNGSTIGKTEITAKGATNVKQMVIDKWGDLIILTSDSHLLKYTTSGVQVGTTINLGGLFYNLNTDSDGKYWYSNALGTYEIIENTEAHQAFKTGSIGDKIYPLKIRNGGMESYNNDITGYNISENGSVGC